MITKLNEELGAVEICMVYKDQILIITRDMKSYLHNFFFFKETCD